MEMYGEHGDLEKVRALLGRQRIDTTQIYASIRPSQLKRSVERSEEHTSELQSRLHLVCRLLLEKKKKQPIRIPELTQTHDKDSADVRRLTDGTVAYAVDLSERHGLRFGPGVWQTGVIISADRFA